MTMKEKILLAVEALPPEATIEDAMEKLRFLAQVEEGLAQAAAGQTLEHEQVEERMAKWLK